MALSDQLTDLASRTKELEDSAAAARERDHTKLEQKRDKLNASMHKQAEKIKSDAEHGQTEARSWWGDTVDRIEMQRVELRTKIETSKAQHKVKKAEQDAEAAEEYAESLVDIAAYMTGAAEDAVLNAAIARSQAEAIATGG